MIEMIREKILNNYIGEYESIIDSIFPIYNILCSLLKDAENENQKKEVVAALAYFAAPANVMPEEIFGAYHYIEHIYISTYVLKKIEYETDKININKLLVESSRLLKHDCKVIRNHVGL